MQIGEERRQGMKAMKATQKNIQSCGKLYNVK
jgi:hypothetical protein